MASVLDLVKHYQHAIEKYPNDEQKVLKSIDKLFNLGVTVQHLQDTGVGRTVNALRKEPGDVGQAARALVYKWKVMVASEESDQETDQNNDTTNCNGHGNGKDSDDSANQSQSRLDDASHERSSKIEQTRGQVNGNTSGSKRKYNSEEEDNSNKKSKQSSGNDDYKRKSINVKRESSESDNDHNDSEDSHSSDSDSELSESSEENRKENQKIKQEPIENHRSSSSKHSSHNHVDHRKETSVSKKSIEPDKLSKSHGSESRHASDKSSSRERSQSSQSKSFNNKEKSAEKKSQSNHSAVDKDNKMDTNSSSKHRSSSNKHSSSDKYNNSSEKLKSSIDKHSCSERHKSSSQKESKSVKHKEKKSDKHESKSDKHSSQAHKSDKEKHKSSPEKEAHKHKSRESSSSSKEKHSSSSKEKSKDRSSSSKEKSGDSHKSEKKVSSHESKSKTTTKKPSESDHRSNEKKSKHKSSSSSSQKSDKSSRKSVEDVPKTKLQINHSADSDDGIDCGSGASFAEALGMISPAKPKKKTTSKELSSPNSFNNDYSPAALLAPSAKLAPLPALEISALPEISPNYRPRPPPRVLPHFTDSDAMSAVISSKNLRTKVYSGNKVIGKIPTLYELCVQVLQEHIDALEFTGGVPYEILKPIVDKATPQQLFVLEYHNPYLTEDTDHLWKTFCEKHFRNKKREEMEAWREMYMRCQEEQEDKLKSLTANIKLTTEAKKAPIKQTKMAYVDSVVKPPRNIARKQAQHGTAFAASASPAARVAALAAAPNVLRGGAVRPPAAVPGASSGSFKPKKAPLMAKALQLMRGRKR